MDARAAFQAANANPPPHFARFYGAIGNAAIGAGMLLSNVEYPTFLVDQNRFGIARGITLVLTHECDLDAGNDRMFNDAALVCPVLPLENVAEAISGVFNDTEAGTWIRNVTARNVNRLVYIPVVPNHLPYGGYLYLNLLTSTHRSLLERESVEHICMLSGEGLREVDLALERHLRRPKTDRVPFQVEMMIGRD